MERYVGEKAVLYDPLYVSMLFSVDTGTESLVQQQFRDEVDINSIVRRYGLTAGMPFGPEGGMYGDFTGITDYDSAVALVKNTQERFMALPAEVREKFGHSAGNLVRFVQESEDSALEAVFAPPPPEDPAVVVDKPV